MEDRALEQLKVILGRQGVAVDAIETLETTDKARMVKMGDYTVVVSRKAKQLDKEVLAIFRKGEEEEAEPGPPSNFILLTPTKLSQNVEEVVRTLLVRGNIRNYFHFKELQYDITQHRMFPPHFLFSDTFKKANPKVTEQFNRFRMKDADSELPRIDSLDIGARLVGARPGDIVYIQRHSDTIGQAHVFRRVVANANVEQ
jgi:DNA-directed RNA polymerase subunit H (RpoH/RPB5)